MVKKTMMAKIYFIRFKDTMIKPISFQTPLKTSQEIPKISSRNPAAEHHKINDLRAMPYYVSFKKTQDTELEKSINYLKQAKKELKGLPKDKMNIYLFDLERLNGIQSGIEVFEDMNLKEITFIAANLLEVAVLRGCYNNCAHCYADGKHPAKETPNQTARMDWDNFKMLTNGMKKLNDRLGFSINRLPMVENQYMTAFHDADCSQIYIEDKDGKIHDWQEIAKALYEATGVPQIFDTAGWYLEDKKAQKRVEKYVDNILNSDNNDYIDCMIISANPYHAQHFRAVEHMWNGNKEKEEEFREKDAKRMANVLFTVSPLQMAQEKIFFNARAISNRSKGGEGLKERDLKKTYDRYFEKLEKLYQQDFENEQKVVWDKSNIPIFIKNYKKLLEKVSTNPTITGKLKGIYSKNSPAAKNTQRQIYNNPLAAMNKSFQTLIDANGDIYMTNFYETYKVDLKLNFKNADKKTQSIAPNLSDKIVTRELIEEHIDEIDRKEILNICLQN